MKSSQRIYKPNHHFANAKWCGVAANDDFLSCKQVNDNKGRRKLHPCIFGIHAIPGDNMTNNGSKTLAYTTYNLPSSISDSVSGSTVTFSYGPKEQMIYQEAVENSITTTSKYYEGEYEEVQQGDVIRAKTTLNGVLVYSTVRKENSVAQGYDISYVHEDHLGSTDSVTSKTATLDTRMLFDPFGSRRKPSGADADATYLASLQKTTFETTSNGYTGHEQIDSVQLIHMGGRMYDPVLGRFLSTDANIQYPEISQSYNRYSYVLNNPLSMVDPSGEESTDANGEDKKKDDKSLFDKAVDVVKNAIGDAVDAITETKGTGSDKPTQAQTAQNKAWQEALGEDAPAGYNNDAGSAAKVAVKTGTVVAAGVFVETGFIEARVATKTLEMAALAKKTGGAYKDIKGIAGNEAHHMPADSVSPLSTKSGPAISMSKVDHAETASYGSSKEARAYRETQKQLIEQGKFKEAQHMDIQDVQSKFGTKYDAAIQQLRDYTNSLGL